MAFSRKEYMMRRKILVFVLFFLFGALSLSYAGRVIEGLVFKVVDGDTMYVRTSNQTILKVRFAGVDAPERRAVNRKTGKVIREGQPFAENARDLLVSKVLTTKVKIETYGTDRYRRILGFVFTQDGENVNVTLVREGLAVPYYADDYEKYRDELYRALDSAKRSKRGMWILDEVITPSQFRKKFK